MSGEAESQSNPAVVRRVAVIGAGVAGLTAAWRLSRDPRFQVSVFDSRDRVGGVLYTEQRDRYLVEHSADMFTTKDPWAIQLCREIELEDEIVGADEARRRAFVVSRGQLQPVPQGFVLMRPTQLRSILTTPILSLKGKMRLCAEPFIRAPNNEGDESLESFVTRRLGQEAFERIVQPLIGGIYTADPAKLSMAATMPAFAEMERKYGSLLRAPHNATEREASGARYGAFVAPRQGMHELPRRLAERLPETSLSLQTTVQEVSRDGGGWRVTTDRHGPQTFDGVIIAAGAQQASRILTQAAAPLAEQLGDIPYASAAVAILGCRRDQIQKPVEGFGFVVPFVERREILATSFASHKFPGRADDDRLLIRVFIGGACQPELLERDDQDLIQLARKELSQLIGLEGDCELQDLIRWNHSMPQYHVGHLDRVAAIEKLVEAESGLELAGNALRGVGVPFCIRSANEAAERMIGSLADRESE